MFLRLSNAWFLVAAFVSVSYFEISEAKIQRSRAAIAEFKQTHPCPANGNRYGPCPGWQIDHVKPLKCKGEDDPVNMQWLTVEQHKAKTSRENRWCRK